MEAWGTIRAVTDCVDTPKILEISTLIDGQEYINRVT